MTIAHLIAQINYRRKALTAAAAAITVTVAAAADGAFSVEELVTIVTAWAAVLGVNAVTNAPKP